LPTGLRGVSLSSDNDVARAWGLAVELLRLTRDGTGAVVRMHWATYRFTRVQETFDGVPASDPG
jgi:hypothetical protein